MGSIHISYGLHFAKTLFVFGQKVIIACKVYPKKLEWKACPDHESIVSPKQSLLGVVEPMPGYGAGMLHKIWMCVADMRCALPTTTNSLLIVCGRYNGND